MYTPSTKKEIVITMDGGVIQDVQIPKGVDIVVKVMDFDTEDADLTDLNKVMPNGTILKENKDNKYYYETIWTEGDNE